MQPRHSFPVPPSSNHHRIEPLQTVPPRLQGLEGEPNGAARAGGFSLHAGVEIAPNEREKLERLCRYVSRPPVASERLALTASGQVRYTLKTPYRDGTTHIVLEPLDLMARLAAITGVELPSPEIKQGEGLGGVSDFVAEIVGDAAVSVDAMEVGAKTLR